MTTEPQNRIQRWQENWNAGDIGFHKSEVHPMLEKHLDKLMPDGKPNKVFFPLCGKSIDMKWLADKGHTVVGVDGVSMALEQFCTEQGLECVKDADKPNLIKSKDGKIRLYCSDIFQFSPDWEGRFDCVWDRGSLVALERNDVAKYVEVLKKLLSPGGRILVEVMEYDVAIMSDIPDSSSKPPPPHPMSADEVKQLYGPEWTVEQIDRAGRKLRERDIETVIYLIKKS